MSSKFKGIEDETAEEERQSDRPTDQESERERESARRPSGTDGYTDWPFSRWDKEAKLGGMQGYFTACKT